MNTDPIADYLTRIRNASAAGQKIVEIPASNTKKAMTKILFDQGYILNYKFDEDDKQGIYKFLTIVEQLKNFDVINFGWEDIVRSDFVRDYIMTKEMLGY